MTRATYYLCRYVRTDEVATHGAGYCVDSTGARIADSLPRAPSYVYRLRRDSQALLLTAYEAAALATALDQEGNPHLLTEADAQDGRAL